MAALLWGMHECCLIGGGILIFIVFSVTDSYDVIPKFTVGTNFNVFFLIWPVKNSFFFPDQTPILNVHNSCNFIRIRVLHAQRASLQKRKIRMLQKTNDIDFSSSVHQENALSNSDLLICRNWAEFLDRLLYFIWVIFGFLLFQESTPLVSLSQENWDTMVMH